MLQFLDAKTLNLYQMTILYQEDTAALRGLSRNNIMPFNKGGGVVIMNSSHNKIME